jgi:hypothetical protein
MAGVGSAVLIALSITIIDLYLAGHGLRPLSAPWLDSPAAGMHLSLADLILLGVGMLAGVIAWILTDRQPAR